MHYVPLVGKHACRTCSSAATQIGQTTLLRFYALHVAVLPLLVVLTLCSPHLAGAQGRLRRRAAVGRRTRRGTLRGGGDRGAGAAVPADTAPAELYGGRTRVLGVVDRESVTAEERAVDDTVFTWPHLLVRHVVVALGVAATVLALGVAFVAPLRGLANPNLTPEPAKAPWYFAGLQELLSHFDPLVAGILVPGGAVLVLVLACPTSIATRRHEARNRKVAIVVVLAALGSRSCSRSSGSSSAVPAGSSVAVDPLVHRMVTDGSDVAARQRNVEGMTR